ncbi:transketolase C-terminal domain-containing protein [Solwaraspora sp. WMMA2056]|uniref:transketolase C-terminal domain-containing protein n=2 Tax=unclassified Solwaraspora TaxID=2627926 RepID=UPI00259B151B|nr:transketolase C-terminal domain-containing protein [Solwaraspora sp. WMMA2056]WJK43498.1 transketolase C-terminal domain-containing protein [Solwaraspora sp. WMMA2056]
MLSDVTTPQDLDERFRTAVAQMTGPTDRRAPQEPVRDDTVLTGQTALALFDAQLTSRHLDLAKRWLRSFGEGFDTLGSSGHEGNAALAAAVRVTDPALLHYRSGGFYCARVARAAQPVGHAPGMAGPDADDDADTGAADAETDPVSDAARDVLRGAVASAADPITGGRATVFGSTGIAVVPTSGTVAAHLPRAVGLALAIERMRRLVPTVRQRQPGLARSAAASRPYLEPRLPWPDDAIVVCSFGDAAVNHAAATAAFTAAGHADHTGEKTPVLFVCEDNGLGLSVRSPDGWVAATLRSRPGLHYFAADGCDLAQTYDTATQAAAWVREQRRPALLHLSTVRLMGHAGTDVESAYRSAEEIDRDVDRDPLVGTARLLVAAGLATPDEIISRYDEVGWQVRKVAEEVIGEPKLATAAQVVATTAPRRPIRVARVVTDTGARAAGAAATARASVLGTRLPEERGPMTLAETINATLADGLLAYPGMIVLGADVAAKGGRYGVTAGLRERFGGNRVFDTTGDATTVLGHALGAGLAGQLPVVELPGLTYLHGGEDQLRGEAATAQFLSRGGYRNPLVLRVPGLAYQDALSGHRHNDNSLAVLRDIPGIVLAVPARAADAAGLLRSCLASAAVDGSVCVFVEPVAGYATRDLYAADDGQWLAPYPPPGEWGTGHVPVGRARSYPVGSAEDLTVITFGNGVRMSLRVAARLAAEGIGCRVVDLRWLAPLPVADIVREATATGRVLIVDETRRSGGVGEGVLAALVEAGYVGAAARIAALDSLIPLGPAAHQVLVSEDAITQGARALLAR